MNKALGVLNACAGLFGACGVAAAAGAAHLPGGEHLSAVALILLTHAAALLALTPRARPGEPGARLWLVSAVALAVGAALFSADVALLALRGARLFPMAAPTGGTILILGWLAAFLAGMTGLSRSYR
jgi:uncharacterized membrane protein YgdD (TMEM256/DUF423 family)